MLSIFTRGERRELRHSCDQAPRIRMSISSLTVGTIDFFDSYCQVEHYSPFKRRFLLFASFVYASISPSNSSDILNGSNANHREASCSISAWRKHSSKQPGRRDERSRFALRWVRTNQDPRKAVGGDPYEHQSENRARANTPACSCASASYPVGRYQRAVARV